MAGNDRVRLFKDDRGTAAVRDSPVVKQRVREEPEKLVKASNISKILYRARGVWPFDFMPDEVIVEETRIIIINNYFPWGSDIGTLPINKLSSIEVTHALIFSGLVIHNTELHGFHAQVKWLTHKDAQNIKEIVDGIKVSELSRLDVQSPQFSNVRSAYQTLGHI